MAPGLPNSLTSSKLCIRHSLFSGHFMFGALFSQGSLVGSLPFCPQCQIARLGGSRSCSDCNCLHSTQKNLSSGYFSGSLDSYRYSMSQGNRDPRFKNYLTTSNVLSPIPRLSNVLRHKSSCHLSYHWLLEHIF
jgi:hypothetical protein